MIAKTPQRLPPRDVRGKGNRTVPRTIGFIYLAFAVGAALFALVTWWVGRLTSINLLVFALAVVGTAPFGLLAWQGDFLGTRNMDEGQREMNHAAQSNAFYVAYFGLFTLFFGYLNFPAWRSAVPVAIGGLQLLVIITWLGGYMWRRWRP